MGQEDIGGRIPEWSADSNCRFRRAKSLLIPAMMVTQTGR
jgi:hypothetical protein